MQTIKDVKLMKVMVIFQELMHIVLVQVDHMEALVDLELQI
jgi:hypothetical protein